MLSYVNFTDFPDVHVCTIVIRVFDRHISTSIVIQVGEGDYLFTKCAIN